jgi:Protein of unknown function (DUF2924)
MPLRWTLSGFLTHGESGWKCVSRGANFSFAGCRRIGRAACRSRPGSWPVRSPKDAPLRNRVISNAGKRRAGFPIEQSATTTITRDHDSRLPMPGGLIVKQFKDQTIVVKVVDDGFEYGDRRYGSLSAIAQEITGTKWNGFLFFGLTKENAHGRRWPSSRRAQCRTAARSRSSSSRFAREARFRSWIHGGRAT